jgi:hypothetical protein
VVQPSEAAGHPDDDEYWARRERLAEHHASIRAAGQVDPITQSERAGVYWSAYRRGRRFRVIRKGVHLVHGNFGAVAGRVEVPVGSIIEVRDWLSDFDGDIHLIWASIDGRPVEGIVGNDPYDYPWAVVEPSCRIGYEPRARAGLDNLPWPEQASAPDPTCLQPVDAEGRPEPW